MRFEENGAFKLLDIQNNTYMHVHAHMHIHIRARTHIHTSLPISASVYIGMH